jgi:hypothetical protein
MACFLAAPSAAQEEGRWSGRLTLVRGEVNVFTAEAPEGLPAQEDMPLEEGDRISTGEDGSAEIAFEQGSHLLSLRSHSDFTLASTRGPEIEFKLALGSLLAKIQRLVSGQSVKVRTPAAVAAVRGTEFGVEVSSDNPEETHVAVFDDGIIEVSGQQGKPERLLSNQETSVLRGRAPLPPYVLRRLARHRSVVRQFGRRSAAVRKTWKDLPADERLVLRRQMLERMRQNRQKKLEKMMDRGRQAPSREQQEKLRKNREKMEKAREKFKKRRTAQ